MPKVLDKMELTNKEYTALNAQAANYRVILRYLKAGGFDNFLREKNLPPVDLLQTPDDTTGGESAMYFLKSLADECLHMDKRIKDLSEALVDSGIMLAKEKRKHEVPVKKGLWRSIRDFIFVNPEEL